MITKNVISKSTAGYIVPVRKDYITFFVLGQEINLISDECYFGRNTVAEINNLYYYLGNEQATISAAILAWQISNNRELLDGELRQVMIDNHIL